MRHGNKTLPCLLSAGLCLFLGAGVAAARTKKHHAVKPKMDEQEQTWGKALGKSESMTGTVITADKTRNLVVLRGSQGVLYTFRVDPKTNIMMASQKLTENQMAELLKKKATIEFVPRTKGNVAEKIDTIAG